MLVVVVQNLKEEEEEEEDNIIILNSISESSITAILFCVFASVCLSVCLSAISKRIRERFEVPLFGLFWGEKITSKRSLFLKVKHV